MKLLHRILCAFLVLVSASVQGVGQVDALSIDEVLNAPSIAAYSPPAFSTDGRLLAYVITDNARRRKSVKDEDHIKSGVAWYGMGSDIWVSDMKTGEHRNLTSGGNNWAPSWSPDGRHLAFLGDRSGSPDPGPARLWLWERASGKLRQASDADVREGFAGIHWTADSRSVLVSLFPDDLGREGYAAAIMGKSQVGPTTSAGVTARVFEFDPSAPGATPSTDQINLDHWRRDLGLVDVETKSVRRLTRRLRIGHYVLSPDGRKLQPRLRPW